MGAILKNELVDGPSNIVLLLCISLVIPKLHLDSDWPWQRLSSAWGQNLRKEVLRSQPRPGRLSRPSSEGKENMDPRRCSSLQHRICGSLRTNATESPGGAAELSKPLLTPTDLLRFPGRPCTPACPRVQPLNSFIQVNFIISNRQKGSGNFKQDCCGYRVTVS